MKKDLLAWFLVLTGVFVSGLFASWWLSALWAVAVLAFCNVGIRKSIMIGAVSFGLVWLIASLYWLRIDDTDMMGRTSALMGGVSSAAFTFVTLFIGLVTGTLSGWLGGALGQIKQPA